MGMLNGLRHSVYIQEQDTFVTKVGYLLDDIMNTTYHCLIYVLNIVMLYTYDDPFEAAADILLNSLAIEFIKEVSFTPCAAHR